MNLVQDAPHTQHTLKEMPFFDSKLYISYLAAGSAQTGYLHFIWERARIASREGVYQQAYESIWQRKKSLCYK